MADYKMLPHNLEAEQAVLGCILLDNVAQADIFPTIDQEDFYSDAHKDIYGSMLKIYQKSIPVDFVTLAAQLEDDKILEKVGGIDYITFLTNAVPSAANFGYYCDIVKANSVRRKLIKSGQDIIENTFKNEDKERDLEFAEQVVFEIAEKQQRATLEHVGKPGGAIKKVLDKFDTIAKDPTSLKGIPTGYRDFDAITNGLQNSDLIILAARPGIGKTSFAMNMLVNASIEQGKKCAVFSLEMPREQLMQRAICSLAKVPMNKALKGTMNADEWQRIWTASKKLEQSGIYIDDTPGITPSELVSKCRRLKAKENIDIVMVDYLQLMHSGKDYKNTVDEVSFISKSLKEAAKELNVPFVVLSQLSRASETRTDHHPVVSDLRDSGSIEQDADIILFLYNPAKYNDAEQPDEPGTVELIVAKHRNGETGTIKLRFIGEYVTFVSFGDKVKVQKVQEINSSDIEETALDSQVDVDVFGDEE